MPHDGAWRQAIDPIDEWPDKHPPGTVVRACIYARTSLGTREEKYSPDEQVAQCRRYCDDRGWRVAFMVIEDDARADFHRRPLWLLTLVRARRAEFDVLVSWRTDRWARSLWDVMRTERFLARHHIAYCSVTEPFDTTTAHGRFVFRTLANVAQLERDLIGSRMGLAFAAKRRRHEWPRHIAPLGYARNEGGTLRIELSEAPLVRLVLETYKATMSGPETAYQLNKAGHRTKEGGTWTPQAVYRITDCPLLTGRWPGTNDELAELRYISDEEAAQIGALRRRKKVDRSPMGVERKVDLWDRMMACQRALWRQEEAQVDQVQRSMEAEALIEHGSAGQILHAQTGNVQARRELVRLLTG